MTDIRLSADGRLTGGTDGDAPLISGDEALLQVIQLEAQTTEGELFYDESFGWSLLDFMHDTLDPLVLTEIEQRIKSKLLRYEEIAHDTVVATMTRQGEGLQIQLSFTLNGNNQALEIDLNRIRVEVISL